MSLRARLLSRSAAQRAENLLVPKDRGAGSAFGLRRSSAPADRPEDDKQAAPLRRGETEDTSHLKLRRSNAEPADEPEREVQSMRPDRAAPAQRSAASRSPAVSRQAEEEEEELQRSTAPVSDLSDAPVAARMPREGPPQRQEAQTGAPAAMPQTGAFRAVNETQIEDEPAAELRHDPAPVQRVAQQGPALTGAAPGPGPQAPAGAVPATDGPGPQAPLTKSPQETTRPLAPPMDTGPQGFWSDTVDTWQTAPVPQLPPSPAASDARGEARAAPDRPRVIIDQIDVVIAEAQPRGGSSAPARSPTSALLARRWMRG
jgi:hypothetical protein